MYETSARFRRAVRTSHRAFSYVEIVGTGERISGITGGGVKLDATGSVRASLSLSVIDPASLYVQTGKAGDKLSQFGTEVAAYRGVIYPDNTTEAVPLGVFRIDSNVPTERESGFELSISARDRSSLVARPAPRPLAIRNGTPINEALRAIIMLMYPAALVELVDNDWTTGTMLIETGSNPWDTATKLAAASGLVLFVDRLGVFRTQPGLDPAAEALWLFDEGENCTFTGPPSVDRASGEIPNGFIVKGSSSGSNSSGVYGEAWDMDPNSPTYRYGPYGENAKVVNTDKAKTPAQAQLAAELLLRQALGRSKTMSYSSLVNPALDPYDVVWVRRPKVFVDEPFYVSSLDIPLQVDQDSPGVLYRHLSSTEAAIEAQIADLVGADVTS